MEKACGQLLASFGGKIGNLVMVCADDVISPIGQDFASQHPDRIWNLGLSYADMLDTAAGLAAGGKLPFVCARAGVFSGACREILRNNICAANMNVKMISIGTSDDEIAALSILPNLKLVFPSDHDNLKKVLLSAIEDFGPVYISVPVAKDS